VDRIGSKTQRERTISQKNSQASKEHALQGLEVGLPYLAATYDERMFDRLYARSQAFDLLTSGDPSTDPDDGSDYEIERIDERDRASQFVALPEAMRRALRVDLSAMR